MKAVIVMFDSLNRHMLEPYGCTWTHTPNFTRLAERCAVFDNSYICSMPCMPARRDMHTARPNFLHRGWGPLEPYDDSVPQMLKQAGIYTHLCSDHNHYWQDGGANYHPRYNTFDLIRGQEGDAWYGQVGQVDIPDSVAPNKGEARRQDTLNRILTRNRAAYPLNVTFEKGIEFIRRNHEETNWMLQIEAFDPHEPFFSLDSFREPFKEHFDAYAGKPFDWPPYRKVQESAEEVEHARYNYAALLNGCDKRLGAVLDEFDRLDLWQDTLLIVCTDHGFLLGEHDCWAKCWMPFYNGIARTPFFIWDPRNPQAAGQRRKALVQPSIDIPVTLLRYFGLEPSTTMTGHDLSPCIALDAAVRQYAIFGLFGAHVNITDGRYVYMRGPVDQENQPLYEYTSMPARMNDRYPIEQLRNSTLGEIPFAFSKGCPNLRIPSCFKMPGKEKVAARFPTQLFDLQNDPEQSHPLNSPKIEQRLLRALSREMLHAEAPPEQYLRLGIDQNSSIFRH